MLKLTKYTSINNRFIYIEKLNKLYNYPTKNENAFSDYLKIKAIKRIK